MIGDAQGFSVKTPITLSRGFSVETLTGATLSWKTELNRSISAVEDGISGGLQHRHNTCCEKGGRHGRWACMVQRWHHRGDVVFRIGGLAYNIASHLTQGHHVYTIYPDIIFQILLSCSRPMTSHHVTCHVTAISRASSSSIKEKEI